MLYSFEYLKKLKLMNRLKEMDFSEYKNYKRPNTEEMNAQGGTLTKLKLDFTSFSQNNTSSLMSSETKNTALHLKDLIEKEIEIWEDYRFVIPKSSFPEANGPVVDLSSLFIVFEKNSIFICNFNFLYFFLDSIL